MAKTGASDRTDPGGRFNSKLFKETTSQFDAKKAAMDGVRADMAAIMKRVEDFGGNKAAFKLAQKTAAMEPGVRNDFLASYQTYCDWLGCWDQGDLFGQPGVPRPPNGDAREAAAPSVEEGGGSDGDAPGGEQPDEDDGIEVVTVPQLDAAEQEGYDTSKTGRDPKWCPFAEGTVLRNAYDRGFLKHQKELAAEITPPRRRGRPPGAAPPAPEPATVGRGARVAGRRGRGASERPAAE